MDLELSALHEITDLSTEQALAGASVALGAHKVPGWAEAEHALALAARAPSPSFLRQLKAEIKEGKDPLGEAFCRLRSPAVRRPLGATYTPAPIVEFIVTWAARNGSPARVVDPGAGSGRFLLAAGSRFKAAELIGIEVDPLAALILRANISASGLDERARVLLRDYRSVAMPEIGGPTLYLGNPPYVRHHLIPQEWKQWLATEAVGKGYRFSQLAGLHAYFFLATALRAQAGDYGAFITAAEWLDVNYGRLIRDVFLDRLGGNGVLIIEPTASPFPDAATTGAITTFRVATRPKSVFFSRVESLDQLSGARQVRSIRRERLEAEERWSHLSRSAPSIPSGFVELGELFRVHRGQVTGANKIWIAGSHSRGLPASCLFPTVTKARDLIMAGLVLNDTGQLRKVIDIPADLSILSAEERVAVGKFLKLAQSAGADQSYVARNRKAWWSVGLKRPAPILATYMARRSPAFVRNLADARHINIAHGLYPREAEVMTEPVLAALVKYLSGNTSVTSGRTYAGGLTKFEPREMERLPVPAPDLLAQIT